MIPPAPWRVVEVELADGTDPVAPQDDRPALLVFRYRKAVLGHAHLLPSDLPMHAAEWAETAAQAIGWTVAEWIRLAGDDERMRPTKAPPKAAALRLGADLLDRFDAVLAARRARPVTLSASIVVCTHGEPDDLARCLDGLGLEREAGREVIVVASGLSEERQAQVRNLPGVRLLSQPRPGINRARNIGLRAARSDVVVFLDVAARPEPGWIDALLRRFDGEEAGVVCGLVLPAELETEAQIAFHHDPVLGRLRTLPLAFDASCLSGWRRGAPVWELGSGGNMAVRRSLAMDLGGFDERLGRGASAGSGGESGECAFWHRVLSAGGTVSYEPLAVVRCRYPRSWAELRRHAREASREHVLALLAARGHDDGALARVLVSLPRLYLRRLRHAPFRLLAGYPDRLLASSLRGYLGGFRHVLTNSSVPASEPAGTKGTASDARPAP
jgi:glycosyltransferase involved in cell wall biosynthesis